MKKAKKSITNKQAQRVAFVIIAIMAAIVMACCFTSCKTPAAVSTTTDTQDSSRTDHRESLAMADSLHSGIKTIHDTIIIHDTIYRNEKVVRDAETETETTIHFGEGGGTYNAKTGDATNVTGVGTKESKKEHELRERVEQLIHDNTTLKHEVDSVVDANTTLKHELDSARKVNTIIHAGTETKPVEMNKWQRFLYTSGIVAWCVVIILVIIGIIKLLRKFKVIPV